MPRIPPLPEAATSPETRTAYNQHTRVYNSRITNMKATLGHSDVAFRAYMEWYPLYEEAKKIIGDRLSPLFAWSISEAADCPLCSTYFRKTIIESGENPEHLTLTKEDQDLLSFGAAIAMHKGFVPESIFDPVRTRFSDTDLVVLTAFAGIMIATNVFNNVIQTEIDDYLQVYKKPNSSH